MIEACRRITASRTFQNAVLAIIVANALLIGIETDAGLFHALNTLVQAVFVAGAFATVARLARLLRALRVVSALPELRLIVSTMLRSIPSLANVIVLLGLIVCHRRSFSTRAWATCSWCGSRAISQKPTASRVIVACSRRWNRARQAETRRPMVLNHGIGVRIPASQPIQGNGLEKIAVFPVAGLEADRESLGEPQTLRGQDPGPDSGTAGCQ